MSRLWPEYMEMVAINDVFAGRPHRCVYGYHSMFEQERIGVVKVCCVLCVVWCIVCSVWILCVVWSMCVVKFLCMSMVYVCSVCI